MKRPKKAAITTCTGALSEEPYQRRRRVEPDRISSMPDAILHEIISYLPTRYAVRTGTLSRRWESLWTFVPRLRFSDDNDELAFIDQTLILHKRCKIKSFQLRFCCCKPYNANINVWVRFATSRDVEELELYLRSDDCDDIYELPQSVYKNSLIKKLTLNFCKLTPTVPIIDWKLIKILNMVQSHLTDDVFRNILLGSPSLECMNLCYNNGINRLDVCSTSLRVLMISHYRRRASNYLELEIIAPHLKSLEISGYISKCRLMSVESLVECKMMLFEPGARTDNDYKLQRNLISELLHSLRHVEKLTLGDWCIQTLSMQTMLEGNGFHSPRSDCKCLVLNTCIEKPDFPGIASLLESSPHLETLIIHMHWNSKQYYQEFFESYEIDEENFWTSQERSLKCLLLHLKTVKFFSFKAGDGRFKLMIPLAQFLLKNARVLEKMVIDMVTPDRDLRDLYQTTKELLSFPRSSGQAVVLFSK